MKNIYFGGNSWTKGNELEFPEEERFSNLLSNTFNANEINNSISGSSNTKILLDLNRFILTNPINVDLIVIMWSESNRYEHFFSEPVENTPILHNSILPEFWSLDLDTLKKILKNSQYYDREIENYNIRKNNVHYDLIKEYNDKLWNKNIQLYHYINHILTVQSLCKLARIPCIMMNVSILRKSPWDRKYMESIFEEMSESFKEELTDIYNLIDWSNWVNHGYLNYYNNFIESGMLYSFKHPTKEGHRIIYNDLMKHIKEKGVI